MTKSATDICEFENHTIEYFTASAGLRRLCRTLVVDFLPHAIELTGRAVETTLDLVVCPGGCVQNPWKQSADALLQTRVVTLF